MWCFQSTNRFPARQFSGMASARGAAAVHHLDEVAADAQSDSIGAALVHCPSVRACSSPARVHTTRHIVNDAMDAALQALEILKLIKGGGLASPTARGGSSR